MSSYHRVDRHKSSPVEADPPYRAVFNFTAFAAGKTLSALQAEHKDIRAEKNRRPVHHVFESAEVAPTDSREGDQRPETVSR